MAADERSAGAATRSWTDTTGNHKWSDPLNWSSNSVPAASDVAVIPFTTIVIDLDGNQSISQLSFSGSSNSPRTLGLTGGTLALDDVNTFGAFAPVTLKASLAPRGASLGGTYSNPRLVIDGPIAAANAAVALAGVTYRGPVYANNDSTFSFNTFDGGGTLPLVTKLTDRIGYLALDNRGGALSQRLNPNLDIASAKTRNMRLALYGNDAVATREVINSITGGPFGMTLDVIGGSSDTNLHVKTLTVPAANAMLNIRRGADATSRLTTDAMPTLIGGTGGAAQTPIVPFVCALAPLPSLDSVVSPGGSVGFVTYDTAVAPQGNGPIGFRPLRSTDYSTGLSVTSATTNIRIVGSQTMSAPGASNVLAFAAGSTLDLAGRSLLVSAGGIWNEGAAGTDVATVQSSIAGGTLSSPRPIFVIAGGERNANVTGTPTLNIEVPVDAPSLMAAGAGNLRLSRANTFTNGVTVNGASVELAHPQAAGSAIHARSGLLRLIGDAQVLAIPVSFEAGSQTANGFETGGFTIAGTSEADVLEINGEVSGVASVAGATAKLLRFNGGGNFGGIFRSTNNVPIELNGKWTTSSLIRATGTIYGTADVPLTFSGGILSPGSAEAIGTMRIRSIEGTLGSGSSTLHFDITGDAADLLKLTSSSPFSSGTGLDLSVSGQPRLGTTLTLIQQELSTSPRLSALSGLSEGSMINAGGVLLRLSYVGGDGNDVIVTVVPEPTFIAAFGIPVVSLLIRRRR